MAGGAGRQARCVAGFGALMLGGAMVLGWAVGCSRTGTRLERVDPPFGSVGGNDDVVLVGAGFTGGITVQFLKRPAKSVVVESPERVRVKTPPGPEGPADVVLTDESGRSFVLPSGFTYRKEP